MICSKILAWKRILPYFTFLVLSVPGWAGSLSRDAADIYRELAEQGLTFEAKPLPVKDGHDLNKGIVTFGAEKEGGNSKIALVMGPPAEGFKRFPKRLDIFGNKNGKRFLKAFLQGLASGEYRVSGEVRPWKEDGNSLGLPIHIDYEGLFGNKDLDKLSYKELHKIFSLWLEKTQNRPFSFIKPGIRRKILTGNFPGVSRWSGRRVLAGSYKNWKPLFGLPEKYISHSHPAADYFHRQNGYEIQFKVQHSYGAYEEFLNWFKKELRDNPDLPEKGLGPGNQRIVWPTPKGLSLNEEKEMNAKTSEVFKNFQAYIALRGIRGKTGITTAKWKNVISDQEMGRLKTQKGIIRGEFGRWPHGHRNNTSTWTAATGGIELRAGTKDAPVAQFLTKVLSSRVASNDWSGIQKIQDWKLVPQSLSTLNNPFALAIHRQANNLLAKRFKIHNSDMRKFFRIVRSKEKSYPKSPKRKMNLSYLVPLWHWENAPYLSEKKKEILHTLTRDFIYHVIRNGKSMSFDDLQKAMADWTKVGQIDGDIQNYLVPHKEMAANQNPHHFPVAPESAVDVNKIDIGIEFTGKMPIKDLEQYSQKADGESGSEVHWIGHRWNLNIEDRKSIIKNVANSLRKELKIDGSVSPGLTSDEKDNNHGHSISLFEEFKDPAHLQGNWRVEWDGIVRNYDSQGNLIAGSARNGVIELVTPKFTPNQEELQAVFKVFKEHSIIPNYDSGGGHISVDLKPFEGNPRAMARFLALFHQYRGTLALMFQSPKRLKSAEPVDVSPKLAKELADFQGTEDQLKGLLYNERYFNRRVGRKTRYLQLDVANYFQDVIPEEFISEDFDIKNPGVVWRQQFRVKPGMRRMEFRMLGAPADAHEAALSIKLIRALLNKALNEKGALAGKVQEINYEEYGNNPKEAFRELAAMTKDLGLSYDEYSGLMARGLLDTKSYLESSHYKPYKEKIADHKIIEDWGQALPLGRSLQAGLSYDLRPWKLSNGQTLTPIHKEAQDFQHKGLSRVKLAEEKRLEIHNASKGHKVLACFGGKGGDFLPELPKGFKDLGQKMAP